MSIRLSVKTNAEVNVTRKLPTDFLITHIHEITIRLDKADLIHKMSGIVFSLNKIIISTKNKSFFKPIDFPYNIHTYDT